MRIGLTVMVLMVFFRVLFSFVTMRAHGDFLNAIIRVHHPHVWVGGGDFFQPVFFKRHTDSKIDRGFGERCHLPGFGLVSSRAGSGWHHYLNIHQFLTNLVHKILLGRNAHKYSQLFACLCICAADEEKDP